MNDRATMNGKPVFTVPSKTIINFDSGFAPKMLCDGPTFTAGTSCPYSCSFCYVPAAMEKQRPWLKKHGVTGKHEDIVIRRENAAEIARRQILSKSEEYRRRKIVIYASPLTDVAANMELVRETVEICAAIIDLTNWDIRLLSKSNLLPKVAQALDTHAIVEGGAKPRERVIYGVSTGTLNDRVAAAFEEGTPLVSKRIASLHWLQDEGYRTFGMICPTLPMETVQDYELFSRDIAAAIRVDRCEHVWSEVINARGESFTRTVKCLLEAGLEKESKLVSECQRQETWELKSRMSFISLRVRIPPCKFRFLQYVTPKNIGFWDTMQGDGAVLLGKAAHG